MSDRVNEYVCATCGQEEFAIIVYGDGMYGGVYFYKDKWGNPQMDMLAEQLGWMIEEPHGWWCDTCSKEIGTKSLRAK